MTTLLDPAIWAALAAVLTALGGWLVKRMETAKGRQDIFQSELSALREEVDRLREDLKDRDKAARENYEEIIRLRTQVGELHMSVLNLSRGIQILTDQLSAADIQPQFVMPSPPEGSA